MIRIIRPLNRLETKINHGWSQLLSGCMIWNFGPRSKYGYSLWLFSQGGEIEPHQVSSGYYPGNRTCRYGVRGCAWISYLIIKYDLQIKMRSLMRLISDRMLGTKEDQIM